MKYVMLAVRDRAADVFGQPFFQTSIGGAIRSFSDEINRKGDNNMLAQHPEDFDLYELGSYDDNAADFEILAKPRQVAVGKDCVRS